MFKIEPIPPLLTAKECIEGIIYNYRGRPLVFINFEDVGYEITNAYGVKVDERYSSRPAVYLDTGMVEGFPWDDRLFTPVGKITRCS